MNIRFITKTSGIIYLRKIDVVQYLFELAAGEETDVRDRLEQAALYLNQMESDAEI